MNLIAVITRYTIKYYTIYNIILYNILHIYAYTLRYMYISMRNIYTQLNIYKPYQTYTIPLTLYTILYIHVYNICIYTGSKQVLQCSIPYSPLWP